MKRICSLVLTLALLLSLWGGVQMPAKAAGNYTKVTSLTVGDIVVFTCETAGMELSGISTTSTKYGLGNPYTGEPAGLMLLEVCKGYTNGTYAFKNNDKYLYWGSSNTLNLNATLSANSSWKVSFDTSGNAIITNSADTARQIWWNNSSPRFSTYTGKSATATYVNVQIYKAGENACFHTETTYSVTTPPTCTEKGVGTYKCANPKCSFSWTESIDALGHSYTFAQANGAIYRICSACNETEALTLNTLAEARAYESGTTVYNVQGIVTYIKGRTVYIEDSTGALCVYFSTAVDTSTLSLGDKIFVSSKMTNYKGLPEMNNPDQFLILSSGNALPNTTNLSIPQILGDTESAHLGKRVTLKNMNIGALNTSGYTKLTDSAGNSISIYALPAIPDGLLAGNIVDVTAIISYYDDGFQLLINPTTVDKDVVKVGNGTAIDVKTVTIAEAKAGIEEEYYQVEGIVTCLRGRQILIQDETGGIVIYLSSIPEEAPCAVGDKVRVYGSFGNYDGVLELQYVDYTNPGFFTVLSAGNAVAAQPVTIEELLRDSALDYEYFAEKVFLNDVSILEIDTDGSVILWDNDYTITIYGAPALNEGCEVGAVVDVTATVSGYNFNYELLIADADAVTFGSTCQHKDSVAVGLIEPSCTENGYSGDYYCTVCGAFVAYGTQLPPTHSIISVNDVPAGCESEGYTGETYCELCGLDMGSGQTIPPLGHAYVAQTVKAPTCTENGYTIYVCDNCEDSYEDDLVAATGHTCDYLDNGETHSYSCKVCGASGEEEHAYEGEFCTLCGAFAPLDLPTVDENIVIRHTLNLASDISINFAVSVASLEGYHDVYLECKIDVYEGNRLVGQESVVLENPTVSGGYYYFTLTGISAPQVADEIEAVLYMSKGEENYMSNTDVYSVATYAYAQLAKSTASENLKALCANLLRYGASAQIFKAYRTDNLADAKLTEEYNAYLTDLETVQFNKVSEQLGDVMDAPVTWVGKSLVLDSKVTMRFIFDATNYGGNVEDLSLYVYYNDYENNLCGLVVEGPTVYNADKNWYSFDFDQLLAAELRAVVSVAVYDWDIQVSETLQYSADTYGNNKTGNLLTVCRAMIAYSDAALAYFKG